MFIYVCGSLLAKGFFVNKVNIYTNVNIDHGFIKSYINISSAVNKILHKHRLQRTLQNALFLKVLSISKNIHVAFFRYKPSISNNAIYKNNSLQKAETEIS